LESGKLSGLDCFDFESPALGDEALILTCRRVWEQKQPVRYVSHDQDGGYQFLCDGNEHTTQGDAVSVHARHIFEQNPDQLRDFTYLRKGCFAKHLQGETWNLGHLTPEED
jgi:hypothetical protein